MQLFTAKVIDIIKLIPEGKVMTYGQIAALAGSPRGARQVVRILHSMSSKYQLPWHRVINSLGEISIKDDELSALQKAFLEGEGIEVKEDNRIDLETYQFHPERI
ncbi:MGMT family protein [Paenibacillus larvae]|uniref:MGMT family protein n=1 Tax=Paenibacillus larvae TaxID=1464 RepID=A0AAP5JU39_9BACL|nr:MGMT family protein [Paenibacillus larvae]MCY7478283.1 MGMT family protein [Paenibacillus larvae]MCY7491928.1 MGMT family protein [Paenibacillus larvae]MCY9565250.1 MGMT family protein [Paenibacillus larvae]MCY9569167.1 MGMT family protein [Paenibacillus larvae]MCY9573905.1 MGMT family protein [Paenibacillus larvae]